MTLLFENDKIFETFCNFGVAACESFTEHFADLIIAKPVPVPRRAVRVADRFPDTRPKVRKKSTLLD